MDITVNVENVKVTDVIRRDRDGDGDTVGEMVVTELVARFARSDEYGVLKQRVTVIRDEEIRKLLIPSITEAIEGGVQRTNTWGEKYGAPVSLRELVMDEAKKILNQPSDSYSRNKGTVLEQTVRAQVKAAFEAEVAQAVKDVREAVAAEFGSTVAEAVTAAVRQAMAKR